MEHTHNPPLGLALDPLSDKQPWLHDPAGAASPSAADRGAEHPLEGGHLARQPVHTQQKGPALGTGAYLLGPGGDEAPIAMDPDDADEP
jgi:hypothetical protein